MKIKQEILIKPYQDIKPYLKKSEQDISKKFDVPDSKIKLNLHVPRNSKSATLSTVNTEYQVKVNFGFSTMLDRNLFTALNCIFTLLPPYPQFIQNQNFDEIHEVKILDSEIKHYRKSKDRRGIMSNYPYEKGKEPQLKFFSPKSEEAIL